jgi:hypothetical protein
MDDFLRYFENKKFVRWVYNPTPELNDYWNDWFRNHPEDQKDAEFARLALLQLQPKKEKVNSEKLTAIYSGINDGISSSRNKPKSLRFILLFSKYAAVALIFLSIGVLLTYQLAYKKFNAFNQSMLVVAEEGDAQLILSDGREIALKTKESLIEYGVKGEIVINQKDTIDKFEKQTDSEMNQLIVPYGKNSVIKLPDGTLAHLNAGSSLMYPSVFDNNKREVFLSGEGYFEVAHNPEKPFIVKTKELDITAVGTIFNVSAYPTDEVIETVLVEGKVILADKSSLLFKKDYTLNPNELATFDLESHKTTTKNIDVNQYVAWHKGYLDFQSTDLSRIVLRLERYYNIRIALSNPMMGARSITGKLILKEDKSWVLKVLASTARAELIQIDENVYQLK